MGLVCLAIGAALPTRAGSDPDEAQDGLEALSDEERKALEQFDLDTVVIQAKRLEPTERASAFSDTLEVKQDADRVTSVSQMLSDAVGVQVRSLGGLGAYGAASIRGSTPNQVPVYLDGVLLNAGGFDSVNLGDLSLDLLERIQIYRGATPAHLGSAGIGGAIELTSRRSGDNATEGAVSVGSFETLRLFALRAQAQPEAGLRSLALITASGSVGDFPYFNDNGTQFNPADDHQALRQNNGHLAASGLFKLDGTLGPWRWTMLEGAFAKDQGLAGIDSVPTQRASLRTARNALSLRAELPLGDALMLAPEFNYLILFEDFDDSHAPHGELGLGRQRTRSLTQALGAGLLCEIQPAARHYTTARLDLRWERVDQSDRLSGLASPPKQRLRSAAALQHEWNPVDGLFVLPGARLEWLHDAFGAGSPSAGIGASPAVDDNHLYWQASLGVRWQIVAGLDLKANVGRSVRTPSLSELFGDRGAVVGNPNLRPERGINTDAGLTWLWTGAGVIRSVRAELAWFGSWTDDLIVYWQNSQDSVRADNIDAAEVTGLEASARVVLWDLIGLSGNYTYLFATNRSDTPFYAGRQLPGRPAHEAFGRIELGRRLGGWEGRLWAESNYTAANFLDPANRSDAGARLLFALGLRIGRPDQGWSLTLDARNLANTLSAVNRQGVRQPLQDFEGFPLPGRTFLATLHWLL